jgi:acetyl esterase/lipase
MGLLNSVLPYFSPILKPDWTVYKDVQYGVTKSEVADLYLLNRGVHPVVVFIHGGGWSAGDKSAYEGRARKYALAGFHVIALNYRLATYEDKTTQWPAQFQDVQLALRWIRQNAVAFRIDPYRVGVGGDSAGGHLALMLGSNPYTVSGDRSNLYPSQGPWPNALLNMFGPCDLGGPGMKELIGVLPLFNNTTYEQNPELYKKASPIHIMTSTFPPSMIMHGTSDEVVPYNQSVALNDRMNQLGIYHKFVTFNGGHEFGKLSSTDQISLEMQGLSFMSGCLRP